MQSDGNHESETSLRNHEKVKELEANLNFFIEHKLLKHAEKLNERLKENLEQMDLKYQLIRYTKDQNQQEELINKTLIYLVNKRQSMNYLKLVENLIKLHQQFENFEKC